MDSEESSIRNTAAKGSKPSPDMDETGASPATEPTSLCPRLPGAEDGSESQERRTERKGKKQERSSKPGLGPHGPGRSARYRGHRPRPWPKKQEKTMQAEFRSGVAEVSAALTDLAATVTATLPKAEGQSERSGRPEFRSGLVEVSAALAGLGAAMIAILPTAEVKPGFPRPLFVFFLAVQTAVAGATALWVILDYCTYDLPFRSLLIAKSRFLEESAELVPYLLLALCLILLLGLVLLWVRYGLV